MMNILFFELKEACQDWFLSKDEQNNSNSSFLVRPLVSFRFQFSFQSRNFIKIIFCGSPLLSWRQLPSLKQTTRVSGKNNIQTNKYISCLELSVFNIWWNENKSFISLEFQRALKFWRSNEIFDIWFTLRRRDCLWFVVCIVQPW